MNRVSYTCFSCELYNETPRPIRCVNCEKGNGYVPNPSFTKDKKDAYKRALNEIYGIKSSYKPMCGVPEIEKVIFREPATIVMWLDGTKTVVKCGENDGFDPEKGLAMAIAKKALGNKGNYYNTFKKWLPEEDEESLYPSLGECLENIRSGIQGVTERIKKVSENTTGEV